MSLESHLATLAVYEAAAVRVIPVDGWKHEFTQLQGPIPFYFNQLWVRDFPAGGFQNAADPSGRSVAGVHVASYQ